ncbi:MAG: DUF3793 family protein [Lachnospiraceae bacterium]|nr:DUF3793 family protein [Lachnospiraceae bacterium]
MCQETVEFIKTMGIGNIEMQLALQCAPLIMGLKMSNLLIIPMENEETFEDIIDKTDISVYRLLNYQGKTVYLLYDKGKVIEFLNSDRTKEVFMREGYKSFLLEDILHSFQNRYEHFRVNGGQFPHEMGLLLGYPVEDVVGFIENRGNNYLYSGYWKVYARPLEKKELFAKFEDAKDSVVKMLSSGISMKEIVRRKCVA